VKAINKNFINEEIKADSIPKFFYIPPFTSQSFVFPSAIRKHSHWKETMVLTVAVAALRGLNERIIFNFQVWQALEVEH
jgi:hypothetical protein